MSGSYEQDCHGGTMGRCWESPKFVAVESLTYEIEIQDMKKRGGDVVEVPVHVRYPLASLIINTYGIKERINEARIYFDIDVSNNWIVGFRATEIYRRP